MSTFLANNVVVYAFDSANGSKQKTAIEVLESDRRLVLSTQVLLETWWVLTRRLDEPLEESRAAEIIEQLGELPTVSTDPQLVRQAIATSRRFGTAIWDALIIEAARSAGCTGVLSEDLQPGQDSDRVTVENPFS